jgi:hypothetical protein
MSYFRDDDRLLFEQSNKEFLAFVEENRPFFSAKRQRSPNPRAAKDRQGKTVRKTCVKKVDVFDNRSIGRFFFNRPEPLNMAQVFASSQTWRT